MRTRSLLAVAAFCAALVLPGMAAAQSIAYAAPDGYTNLRSGPGTNYTIIGRVYPGSAVDVLGCLETRAWCDVIVQNIRGWMAASRLEFVYSGRRVLVPDYYTYFGAPYVMFRFGDHRRRHSGGGYRPPITGDDLPGPPGIFPEEGGGRDSSPRGPNYDQGGNSVFPEEGGGVPPPAVSDDSVSGEGNAGPCPTWPNCQ